MLLVATVPQASVAFHQGPHKGGKVSLEACLEAREGLQACKDRKQIAEASFTTSQLSCLECASLRLADLIRSGLWAFLASFLACFKT